MPLRRMIFAWLFAALYLGAVVPPSVPAEEAKQDGPKFTEEQLSFFHGEVKPILTANCFKCHGGKKKIKGKLRLTSRSGILKGGDSGSAVDLAQPAESLLLSAINYEDYEMPPQGKLPAEQIAVLSRWIEMGLPYAEGDLGVVASDDADHGSPQINEKTRNHWSFRPIERPQPPTVKHAAWIKQPTDAFLLHRLEAAGLKPSKPADKVPLLRRAYYDLVGLPPSPREVDAFLADNSPQAYEKVIDRLLKSPQYGEKWGRHWLDLVHYAESNSFERDNPKPEVWRYRDYVIRSFNEDKPFDQFLREQLAGDELEQVTPDSIIATGYYRLGLWDDESADPAQTRFDELDDWVTVTSQVFLGLTINCCRCHDHKLDPIPQEDYYRFQAFFRGVQSFQAGEDGLRQRFNQGNFLGKIRDVLPPADRTRIEEATRDIDARINKLNEQIAAVDNAVQPKLPGGIKDDYQYESNRLPILRELAGEVISGEELSRYEAAAAERDRLALLKSQVDAAVLCVKERRDPPTTYVKIRGGPTANGKEVSPGFPQVLGFADPQIAAPAPDARTSGRRRALAEWLAGKENPLVARVTANRLWQHHFGRGLVRSPNNFGLQGDVPTHPQLLDWLASELVEGGWHFKRMHKLIMLSNAYQMSSQSEAAALEKDPENNLFWRYDMRRLTAEEIRDSILAVNGRLNLKMGGPSIYEEIPAEVLAGQSRPGQNWKTSSEEERGRRSIYIHVKRTLLVPFLEQFDVADTDNSCPVRFATTVPTQALGSLNSKFINDQAKVFADRLKKEAGDDMDAMVRRGLQLTLGRPIEDTEVARGKQLIEDLQKEENASPEEALRQFCLMALNLNEFIYLD